MLDTNPEYKELHYLSLYECTKADLIEAIKRHCTCDHNEDDDAEDDWFKKNCSVCNPDADMHDTSLDEIRNKQFRLKYLPVVDSHENMNLLFMIELEQLKRKCEYYFGFIQNNDGSTDD